MFICADKRVFRKKLLLGNFNVMGYQENHSRSIFHYIFSVVVLSIYGGEVCPFIDKIELYEWILEVFIVYGVAFCLRIVILSSIFKRASYENLVRSQFTLDSILFISAALVITIYNTVLYDFPVGSGLKIMLASISLGFFAANDLALERERQLWDFLNKSGKELSIKEKYFPLTKRFALFASLSIVLMVAIIFLLITRDVVLFYEIEHTSPLEAQQGLFLELVFELIFVATIFLLEIINVIFAFSRNLKIFLLQENEALTMVAQGNYDTKVSVATNDEFGVMAKYTNVMISELRERTKQLSLTQEATIVSMATLAEYRDPETGGHIKRTQNFVRALAIELAKQPKYAEELNEANIHLLYLSAPLHDIGKVGIPDNILLKPGKLTDEEFEIMKKHAEYGEKAIIATEKILGQNTFLNFAREIAGSHQEKWDGSGYPRGLAGEDIPLSARLMALADVYDALRSKRVYKPPMSHTTATEIIIEGKGKHFDPAVVDAFLVLKDAFKRYGKIQED